MVKIKRKLDDCNEFVRGVWGIVGGRFYFFEVVVNKYIKKL